LKGLTQTENVEEKIHESEIVCGVGGGGAKELNVSEGLKSLRTALRQKLVANIVCGKLPSATKRRFAWLRGRRRRTGNP